MLWLGLRAHILHNVGVTCQGPCGKGSGLLVRGHDHDRVKLRKTIRFFVFRTFKMGCYLGLGLGLGYGMGMGMGMVLGLGLGLA